MGTMTLDNFPVWAYVTFEGKIPSGEFRYEGQRYTASVKRTARNSDVFPEREIYWLTFSGPHGHVVEAMNAFIKQNKGRVESG